MFKNKYFLKIPALQLPNFHHPLATNIIPMMEAANTHKTSINFYQTKMAFLWVAGPCSMESDQWRF